MRGMNTKLALAAAAVFGGLGVAAQALGGYGATLSLKMTADNSFNVYLANSDSELGTLITLDNAGSGTILDGVGGTKDPAGNAWQGNVWGYAYSATRTVGLANKKQYLHIVATDQNTGGAGFLAELTITDDTGLHTFDNGQLTLLTTTANIPTTSQPLWRTANPLLASTPNADSNYGWSIFAAANHAPSFQADNPGTPWTSVSGIAAAADWIWDGTYAFDGTSTKPRFFSTTIEYSAVPEATTMILGGLAVMPILMQRRRQRGAAAQA